MKGPVMLTSAEMTRAQGLEILRSLIEHKHAVGGTTCIITGIQGSGKTSLMLQIAQKLAMQGELVIWRGRQREQVHKLKNWMEKTVWWFPKSSEPRIWKVTDSRSYDITSQLDVKYYSSLKSLYQGLEVFKINIVFPAHGWKPSSELLKDIFEKKRKKIMVKRETTFWVDVIYYLTQIRKSRQFVAIFLDEADDVIPSGVSDQMWWLLEYAKDLIKDARKSYTSVYFAVHNLHDIDYRIVKKCTHYIYLRGARLYRNSLVDQKKVALLGKGEAIIEHGSFGKFRFDFLKHPPYDIVVEW
ncbi:MAG: hypothetical protein ACXQS5_03860 [Candidatus Methanospirareceae archaeon]